EAGGRRSDSGGGREQESQERPRGPGQAGDPSWHRASRAGEPQSRGGDVSGLRNSDAASGRAGSVGCSRKPGDAKEGRRRRRGIQNQLRNVLLVQQAPARSGRRFFFGVL